MGLYRWQRDEIEKKPTGGLVVCSELTALYSVTCLRIARQNSARNVY